MGHETHGVRGTTSRTTHPDLRPMDAAEQSRRSRIVGRNLVVYVVGLGVLSLAVAVVCLAWSLTAHTVVAQVTTCGPPDRAVRGGPEQTCRVEWSRGGRTSSGTVTYSVPAPAGQQRQLSVDGLGTHAVRRMEHLGWFGLGFAVLGSAALLVGRVLGRHLRAR